MIAVEEVNGVSISTLTNLILRCKKVLFDPARQTPILLGACQRTTIKKFHHGIFAI